MSVSAMMSFSHHVMDFLHIHLCKLLFTDLILQCFPRPVSAYRHTMRMRFFYFFMILRTVNI